MIRFDARFRWLAGVLVGVNVIGLALIYRAATSRPPGGVRILAALPDRDVDDADRFSLLFDESLVGPSVVGQPPERTIFRIEPSPDGGWVWASPDRLEYRLSKPLPPGRVFQVRPAVDFTAATGRRLVGDREFRFQTRPLRVLETFIKSADRKKVTVSVRFNQPVSPTDLLHHLQVRDDGSGDSLEPLCLVREPADELILHVNRPHSDRLRLVLDKDLAGAGAELPLASSYVTTLKPAKQFRLDRAGVSEYSAFDREINVWLSFSRRLKPGQVVEGLSITPPVNDHHWELLDERLVVTAAFVPGNRYQITIAAGLLSADGDVLHENTTASVDIRDRWSGLRFPCAQGFLNPNGNLLLDLEATNVSGIVLDAREVLPANLVYALQGHEIGATARVAAERTVPLDLRRNEIRKLTVDLQKLLGIPRGFYRVSAADVDHRWRTTEATICVSDLALTAKEGRDGSVVWVTRLSTAEPVSGCRVKALSYNNQELASAVTDEGGLARLLVPANHAEGRAWLFIAENNDDRTFLVPSEQNWVVDDADQSGRGTPETYDVMLYAERGVYRPGDTIHLTGIIRDTQGHIPPTFPLSVKVRRPDGREEAVRAVRTTPGGQGLFHLDYPTNTDGQLGEYDFSVSLPGSNETIGGTTAFVEHFLPVRLELRAEPAAESFGPGEKPAVEVVARYLFDKPAAGVPVAVSGTYCLVPYKSTRCHGFVFGDERRRTESPVTPINGHLDPEGRLSIALDVPRRHRPSAFPDDGAEPGAALDPSAVATSQAAAGTAASLEPPSSMPGVWEARLTITVTEPGSRSVSRSAQFLADTSGRHVGVRLKDGQVVSAGSAFEVEWVHVGADDQPMTRMFRYRLDRVDRDSSLELVDGRYVWKSIERLTPIVLPADVPTSAEQSEGMFSLQCPTGGQYRLTLVDHYGDGSLDEESTVVDVYAAADEAEAQLLVMKRPERLEIVLDRKAYRPGEPVRALVRSPFPGTMLLTLETDEIIHEEVRRLESNTASIDLTALAGLRGGGFLTATVVRAIDPSQDKWMPHRAIGVARLGIDHADRQLPLALDLPRTVRPGDAVSITATTSPPASADRPGVIHLWAVDDGILLTTDFKTPDPVRHFFAPRAAWVDTSDVFSLLLPDYRRPAGTDRIGGDDDGTARDIRRGAVALRSREAAVVWRTAAAVDSQGRLVAELVLPDLTGRMRMMAVAVDHDRYATAEQMLVVAAPLVLEAGWPRFTAPGDAFRVPVKLFNSTDRSLAVHLACEIDGPLKLEDAEPDLSNIPVPAGDTALAWLSMAAVTPGACAVKLVATAGAPAMSSTVDEMSDDTAEQLHADNRADLVVRPAAAWAERTELLTLVAGEKAELLPPSGYLPGTVRTSLTIGPRPGVELLPALLSVVDYPYGCVEQTASRLLVLLHAGEILSAELPGDFRVKQAEELIEAGVGRLWSMQTQSGGVGFWPGERYPDRWGSIYVGGLLAELHQAGREVDPRFVDPLLAYLKGILNSDECSPAERAQICFALAAWDRPAEGWMVRLAERLDQLDMEGRAHLTRAWHVVGRDDRARAMLADDTIALTANRSTGGRLTSQVRQEAVLLNALLEVVPSHTWVPELVRRLNAAMRDPSRGSTLENASAVAALARYQLNQPAEDNAAPAFTGTLQRGDETVLAFDHKQAASYSVDDPTGPLTVETAGTGQVFLTISHRGLRPETGAAGSDSGLEVRRSWKTVTGVEIDPAAAAFRVGDLILVELTLRAPGIADDESLRNIVIIDALPGAAEVENPRLVTSAMMPPGVKLATAQPDRVEFLDDRVLMFTGADRESRTYCYAMRITTAGRFTVPPVQALCMYDPSFASIHGGGGHVEVQP